MPTHILIIEDNAPNLELMSYLLRAFEYVVSTAEDGGEGLEAIRSKSPDLVICDVHLPTMSGYEVAREMKQDPRTKDIPVVAVTALAMVGDRDKVLSAGFDGYIAKPIAPEVFVEEVEKFLGAGQRSKASPTLHGALSPSLNDSSSLCRATILVLDDVAVNISLIRTILEPFGYRIQPAATIHEALLVWQEMKPDLIITDVHLKDGTGFDLLRRVRGDGSFPVKPVLFLSGQPIQKIVSGRSRQAH
jgi:two-component system, cell cycle response regulator